MASLEGESEFGAGRGCLLPEGWMSAPDRCKHGVRYPHECKACADEPSADEIAAWMRAEALVVDDEPQADNYDEEGGEDAPCPACGGDGHDPMSDYALPCERCNGCDECTDYGDEADEDREPTQYGCCLPPGECCMPGLHFPSECHTAADYERPHGADWREPPTEGKG